MTRAPTTAFGIQPRGLTDSELAVASRGFAGIVHQLDAQFAAARRDAAIAWASGRWRPGRPDPETYVPGDVAALRGFAVAADLARVASYQSVIAAPTAGPPEDDEVWRTAVTRTLTCLADTAALYDAVPHFLDAETAVGILSSRPPEPSDLADLRLPYPRICVWFGRVLELGAEMHDWPPEWDHLSDLAGRTTSTRTVVGDLRALGGGIEGVVLTEKPDGGLADEVLWLVSVNPDASRPGTAALDRYRTTVWGRPSSARLAHVARNLAATVSWAEAHEPDRRLVLPDDPGSRDWRKAVRRGELRRHEPRGAAADVRVLDVSRTPVGDRVVGSNGQAGTHASPVTHLRRAHWRHQPVGAGLTEQRLVRVPATVVNPGGGPLAPVVYRVPAPDDIARRRPEITDLDEGIDLRHIDLPDHRPGTTAEATAGDRSPARPSPHQHQHQHQHQPEVSLP